MTEDGKAPGLMSRITSALARVAGGEPARPEALAIHKAESEVIRRMSEAYQSTRPHQAKLDSMRFSSQGGGGWSGWSYPSTWPGRFQGSEIDYRGEVGSLAQSSLVMAVVNWIAMALPEAPLQVISVDEQNQATVKQGHELVNKVNLPNPYHIGADMWMAFSFSWWLDGNVYWHKVRDGRGRVSELWYVPHYMMEPYWPQGEDSVFIESYVYRVNGKRYFIPTEDVVHFRRGINPDNPRKGLGAFDSVLREIYGDHQAANFAAALLKNTGVASHVISPEGDGGGFTQADAEAAKERFIRKTTGDRRGEPIVETIPLKIERLGFSPQELDLNRLRFMPEARVAAVTGIPAAVLQFMIGQENGTSYASYEQAREQAYESVVMPLQQVILAVLNQRLLPEFSTGKGEQCRFDHSQVRVLQEDNDKKGVRIWRAFTGDMITRGVACSALGFAVPQDGTADLYYSQIKALASAMQYGGAPPPNGQQPKHQTVHISKHVEGNGHGVRYLGSTTEGARFSLSGRKAVEWEGLRLSREPNEYEKVAVKSVADAQESGKEKIAKTLLKVRSELITEAASLLSKMKPAEYHTLVLTPSEESKEELRDRLASVYEQGQGQVASELGGKKARQSKQDEGEAEEDELDDLAALTLASVANDTQAKATAFALKLAVLGLAAGELEKRLTTQLEESSTTASEQAAAGAANRALGLGRQDEMEAREDEIERYQYSALLDANTCASACEPSDGLESENVEDLPPTPNPECEGAGLCRCFTILIAAGG